MGFRAAKYRKKNYTQKGYPQSAAAQDDIVTSEQNRNNHSYDSGCKTSLIRNRRRTSITHPFSIKTLCNLLYLLSLCLMVKRKQNKILLQKKQNKRKERKKKKEVHNQIILLHTRLQLMSSRLEFQEKNVAINIFSVHILTFECCHNNIVLTSMRCFS